MAADKTEKAIFAGGCFWCTESAFKDVPGIISAVSGYTGGPDNNPTYDDYVHKGHTEAVEVTYDPSKISYEKLLDMFWREIDPTDAGGQFADRGPGYKAVIFYADEAQKKAAEESKKKLDKSGIFKKPIVTEILPAKKFFRAEEYHQNYCKINALRYKAYRKGSGREDFLAGVWGRVKNSEGAHAAASIGKSFGDLKKKLTPLQYQVTQDCGTEPAFQNAYWDNHRGGIYVDVVSGEPLFASTDKFDSGTGWPSFTKPLKKENVIEKEDNSHFMRRVEVKSKSADSHLGHVFDDGPKNAGGRRYCINSASLRFIPKEDLEKEGLGEYKKLFS